MQLLPFVPIALVKHRPLVEKNVIVAIQAVIISLWPEYTSDLFFLSPFFFATKPYYLSFQFLLEYLYHLLLA